ncbi:MAG TPA: radical SAM protein [Thermoplasmata archaeon]
MRCTQGCAFGPVPSRRLGQSLGVNTVPCKTCTYSCVYCQLGATTHTSVERRAYYHTDRLVEGVLTRLASLTSVPDYVTFLGCGEPTLASNMGDILKGISARWEGKKALLTNGALLWMNDVRKESFGFDVVIPTISAGNEQLFRKIHRPHPSLNHRKVLEGIRQFATDFPGEFWIEVMLLGGVNDDRRSLEEIRTKIEPLKADKIHLTAPIRPPTERWVRCPTKEAVELAMSVIPGALDKTEPEEGGFGSIREKVVEDLLNMARIHPMREEQVFDVFRDAGLEREDASDILKCLLVDGIMMRVEHRGRVFYRTKG